VAPRLGKCGFYLPLMIVLWLLILRGASIEFRNHIKSAVWDPLWGFLFCSSSVLPAVFFGAALGNVVRGVPLDASGYFFEPLWTNFRLGEETGILDWYTILVGGLAFLALAMHGGLWVQMKTSGAVSSRGKASRAGLVGRACFHCTGDGGDIQGATSSEGKLHDLARGICFPAACSLGNRRSCSRIAKTQ
jgi:cytochrome bd-type quinol oxidase subunit 2